jgi:hypothetical protein
MAKQRCSLLMLIRMQKEIQEGVIDKINSSRAYPPITHFFQLETTS